MKSYIEIFCGPTQPAENLVWLQRRETWEGDVKANRIRLGALAFFAVNECLNYYGFHIVDKRFHLGSLLIIGLWSLCAAIFGWMLRHHHMPRHSPFVMVSVDLLWLSWLLCLADGPKSPLVVIYFLIIALSGTRLNPRLCLFTAGVSILGYLSVLQFVKTQAPQLMVARSHETIIVMSLVLMGTVMAHLGSRVLTLLGKEILSKEVFK